MNMKDLKVKVVLIVGVMTFIAECPDAGAQGIICNTANTTSGASMMDSSDPCYQSFTTGANGSSLNGVSVDLNGIYGSGFALALYSDNANSLGSQIAALAVPATLGTGLQTFTTTSQISLSPLTQYWWAASDSDPSSFFLLAVSDTTGYATSDAWSMGQGWSTFNGSYGNPYVFSVDASVVAAPEPSTLVLTAIGCAAVATWSGRRKRN